MNTTTKYIIGGTAALGLIAIIVGVSAKKNNTPQLLPSEGENVLPNSFPDSFPQVVSPDPFESNYFGRKGQLDKTYPRGIRNNNPGNIKKTNIAWGGEIPDNQKTDAVFEQFKRFEDGVRATIKNSRTHVNNGHNTITKLITKWAPPVENNTAAYIAFVEKDSGISRNSGLVFTNKETVRAIVKSICKYENTASFPISNAQFDKAWGMI